MSRHEYEQDCPCGKGKLLIEISESDYPFGPYDERKAVRRACAACRNDKAPQDDREKEKAEAAEFWSKHGWKLGK